MLKRIYSGGQIGADQAGLFAAERFSGLETGGQMPLGWITQEGPRPDFEKRFGMTQNPSPTYPPRTKWNAENSDGTVRLAGDFSTSGERCTEGFLKKAGKPYFNVDLTDPPPVAEFLEWLSKHNIETLNVAGNSDRSYYQCFQKSHAFLCEAFFELGFVMVIDVRDVLSALGLDPDKIELSPSCGPTLDYIGAARKKT